MAESTESTALDLGLALPTFLQFGAPDPGLVRSVAHEAETAGFDRLWCFDHILWHRPFIDALTATTIGLEATDRIAVGPGVLQALLRPPVVLAASLGSLIDVAEGRLGWGLGVGEHQREYDAAERLTAPTHRWDAMVEHHRAVAAALSTGGRSAVSMDRRTRPRVATSRRSPWRQLAAGVSGSLALRSSIQPFERVAHRAADAGPVPLLLPPGASGVGPAVAGVPVQPARHRTPHGVARR